MKKFILFSCLIILVLGFTLSTLVKNKYCERNNCGKGYDCEKDDCGTRKKGFDYKNECKKCWGEEKKCESGWEFKKKNGCKPICKPECKPRCEPVCEYKCEPECKPRCEPVCRPRCKPRCKPKCKPYYCDKPNKKQYRCKKDNCGDDCHYDKKYCDDEYCKKDCYKPHKKCDNNDEECRRGHRNYRECSIGRCPE